MKNNIMARGLVLSLFLLSGIFSGAYAADVTQEPADFPAQEAQSVDGQPAEADSKNLSKAEKKRLEKEAAERDKQAKRSKSVKKKSSSNINMNSVETVGRKGVFQSKTVENLVGNIQLLVKGSVGSFQFYSLNDDMLSQPMLAGYDEFTSSFFSLKVGKKEYRLSNNIGIVIGARKIPEGAQMVYVVPDVARVLLTFECLKSSADKNEDILKITAVVKNRSKRTDSFALKNVLDTFLGEQKGPHFSTAEDISINSEMQYRKFDKVKWIVSGNNKAAMQILVYGADITAPEVVSLGNKDLLTLPSWVPVVVRSRTFDSVLSYNNSAVCINWDEVRLAPEDEASFCYYMAFATDGDKPAGEKFIYDLEKKLKKAGVLNGEKNDGKSLKSAGKENVSDSEDADPSYPAVDNTAVQADGKDSRQFSAEYIGGTRNPSSGQDDKRDTPHVRFDVDTIGIEKLNHRYIQELIEKINSLEEDDENLDRDELLRLNAELDAILEKLRQM